MKMTKVLLMLASMAFAGIAFADVNEVLRDKDGKIVRSYTAKKQFAIAHPCPLNGKRVMSCKGYVIDHIKPLCAGGDDLPGNMQWQTIEESKAKDVGEKRQCALIRKANASSSAPALGASKQNQ